MRLIDADELKKAFEDTVCIEPMPYAFVKQIIDNAPTVEPTFGMFRAMLCETCQAYATNRAIAKLADEYTRPHGKWQNCGQFSYNNLLLNRFKCSECKLTNFGLTDYCPNCGADMREES